MEISYEVEIRETAETMRSGPVPARRRGEGRPFDLEVALTVLRKDGQMDRRRCMAFDFGDMRVLASTVQIRWRNVGSSGPFAECSFPRSAPRRERREVVDFVKDRLNDMSKTEPFGEDDAVEFLSRLRKLIVVREVMTT